MLYSPNKIRDITDKYLIENILNNIIHSFKKHELKENEIPYKINLVTLILFFIFQNLKK